MDNYKIIEKLGIKGKDGNVYSVKKGKYSKLRAMKKFRKNKSLKDMEQEVLCQILASKAGITPKLHDCNADDRFIVMDKLDTTLFEYLTTHKFKLPKKYQLQLVDIFRALDDRGVYHKDPNPLNFMFKDGNLYIIDFGFAQPIDQAVINKYGNTPNYTYMIPGLILVLKGMYKDCKFPWLLKHITKENRKLYDL